MTASTSPPTIASIGERALIERIARRAGPLPDHVIVGIGDDCAVIRPDRGELLVVTTDSLIEGVHFNRSWTAARAIGHKALAVNLSDLGAMGATPRAAQLSLGLPPALALVDFDDLIDGFLELAGTAGVALIGGNISASPGPLFIDVTALGSAHPRKLLSRSGAEAGDDLYLTGAIGGAAAGLAWLSNGRSREEAPDSISSAIDRYERPAARWRCGRIVARARAASAAIDLSDGLAEAARQMGEASDVGIELDADAIVLDDAIRLQAQEAGQDPLAAALAGGEDYELLFAVPPRRRSRFLAAARRCRDVTAVRIGVVREGSRAVLRKGDAETDLPEGFRHLND